MTKIKINGIEFTFVGAQVTELSNPEPNKVTVTLKPKEVVKEIQASQVTPKVIERIRVVEAPPEKITEPCNRRHYPEVTTYPWPNNPPQINPPGPIYMRWSGTGASPNTSINNQTNKT